MMNKNNKVVHFGSGNIGRGLIGQICKENNINLTFVDLSKEVIDKLKNDKSYTITCLPSNTKIKVDNFSALNLVDDKQSIIESISNADLVSTSIGINNLSGLIDILISSLKIRKLNSKLVIACFENGFKASEQLYKQIIDLDQSFVSKLDFINIVVDRLVPNQNNNSLDVSVEDFYSVWYQKHNNNIIWPFDNLKTQSISTFTEVVGDYQNFFNKKFYGVNGLHFAIAMIGYKHNKQYINQTINDLECKKIIDSLIDEISISIANLTNQNELDIKNYLINNVNRFANKYLLDEIERVARNAKQKISENERLLPILNWLKLNNKKHKTLDYIFDIANQYINQRG